MSESATPKIRARRTGKGVTLAVRLTPRSGADEIAGVELFGGEPVLKARVRALPVGGHANEALIRLIADWLEVPRSSVSIAQGGKSRLKQVLIEGDAGLLSSLIAARLAAAG